ncbi:MAG: RNA polymerase sigma factor [Planctomycetota bacterium]|jgi:RNA polymerase sigma-70 factor (ECF subfamily)
MSGKAISYGQIWDFAIPKTVDESRRWVLSAMQSHGQELVTMLWRILGNEQDVCDAYQSTFLRLAHYEGRGKPEHIKAYIFRSASNMAISMLRRRAAERRRLSQSRRVAPSSRDASSPANELNSKYLQEALRCCIAQLPEHLRNVVTLRDLAELSYAQIGRILSISSATARVYRCKAIQLLAVWMNKEKEERK